MDPMMRMLCGMLKIKPEELQTTLAGIGDAATWFKNALESVIQEQAAQRAILERIEANVGSSGVRGGEGNSGPVAAGKLAAE